MFQGSIVALITPMRDDGKIDEQALRQLVDFHIEQGTDALVAVGTTGESPTLTHAEHKSVIRIVIEQSAKRVPVIAGSGSNATAEALELTQAAKDLGADACLLVVPYYNKPTQEGLYQHYQTIAKQVAIPQFLYNVPGRTACDLKPETVARLAKLEHIVGIKDATGDLSRVARHRQDCGADFLLFSGNDDTALEFILQGGNGVISVSANVAPRAMHQMCSLALSGQVEEAREVDATLAELHRVLFLEANPIPVKWAVHQQGRAGEQIRLPLTPLSAEYHEAVRAAMRTAGV